jgi:hypothetical protein
MESETQRKAFEFLLKKYNAQELFTLEEFKAATGWTVKTFKIYLSKQFKDLLLPVDNAFRIHGVFGQYAKWAKFRDHVVSQRRRLVREYQSSCFESVMVFEFFMPLRNEEYLRTALDALFYKDSILTRLRSIDESSLHKHFARQHSESSAQYLESLCSWIGDKFVGYSIHHVAGRFRAGALRDHAETIKAAAVNPERYLVDETTAVVRFITPCGKPGPSHFESHESQADELDLLETSSSSTQVCIEEAAHIRWFFGKLFVRRIIEVVAGEDEIWLLESGMSSQLHIWRARD